MEMIMEAVDHWPIATEIPMTFSDSFNGISIISDRPILRTQAWVHQGTQVRKEDLQRNDHGIRYIEINDQKFFVAVDIAKIGGQNSYYVTRKIAPNNVFKSSGYRGGLLFVSESGIQEFLSRTRITAYENMKEVFS